jgi:hypothetical protein
MERLRGEPLTAVWQHLSVPERQRLATELGEALADLHAITAPELDALDPADWEQFLADQRAGCADRHRAAGLDSAWLAQVPAFLDAVALDASSASPRPVVLHTEVMREHLLMTSHPDGWSLSGLVDSESAKRGAREYVRRCWAVRLPRRRRFPAPPPHRLWLRSGAARRFDATAAAGLRAAASLQRSASVAGATATAARAHLGFAGRQLVARSLSPRRISRPAGPSGMGCTLSSDLDGTGGGGA